MRKRTINCLFDRGFWFLISILPLIAFVIMLWFNGQNGITLSTVFTSCGFGIVADNAIVTTLMSIFGVGGVFPLFSTPDIIVFLIYFISINLIHLAVDVLLWIPRLGHRLIDMGSFEK